MHYDLLICDLGWIGKQGFSHPNQGSPFAPFWLFLNACLIVVLLSSSYLILLEAHHADLHPRSHVLDFFRWLPFFFCKSCKYGEFQDLTPRGFSKPVWCRHINKHCSPGFWLGVDASTSCTFPLSSNASTTWRRSSLGHCRFYTHRNFL